MTANVGNSCAVVDRGNRSAVTQRKPELFGSALTEALLETAIEVAKQRMCDAPNRKEKLEAWREWVALLDQRTPERVRFLRRMREYESNSPPSTSARIAKASAECRGNAAGGGL